MLRPGSLWWLLWWDLRLAWRDRSARLFRSKAIGQVRLGFNLLLVLAILHALGWIVTVGAVAGRPGPSMQLALLSLALGVAMFTAVSTALATAVNVLFVRNDLDLLCATPVPTRNVFAARCLSIALQALAFPAMFFLPAADVAALRGGVRWLAIYPMTLAIGLVAAALGLALTIMLVRAIGPRRARIVALALSVLLGACFLLVMQAPRLLGVERKRQLAAGFGHWLASSPLAAPDSWIWLPARAVRGEAGPLCLSLVAAALLFALATLLLPRGFAYALRHAAGIPAQRAARSRPARGFSSGLWRVMFAKEWRLIYRDPQLLIQLLQQFVGLIPALVLLLRSNGFSAAAQQGTTACLATIVSGMLGGTLIWLALCAEDMPELLAGAPRPRGQLRRIKLVVVLLPVWLAALVLSSWISWPRPWMFLALVSSIAGCTLSIGVFHLWLPMPASRKDLRRRIRPANTSLGRTLVGLSLLFGWAGFAWCFASMHLLAAWLLLPVALAGPLYAWVKRDDGGELSY